MKKLYWRILALFLDLSIAFWPYHLGLSFPKFEVFHRKVDAFFQSLGILKGMGPTNIELLSSIFILYTLCFLIRFYVTFFLGKTIGQLLTGLYCNRGFWWKRLGGSVRILLEYFLAPLAFTFLPLLRGGATIHERLTDAPLVLKVSKVRKIVSPLLIGVGIFIMFSSPLALNIGEFYNYEYYKAKVFLPDINQKKDFTSFIEYDSEVFGFSTFSDIENEQFYFFPGMGLKKKGRRLIKVPVIYIYDIKRKKIGKMTVQTRFSMRGLASKALYANPFFKKNYPALASIAIGKKVDNERDIEQEIKKLVDGVFNLQLKNIPSAIFEMGPSLVGPSKLRRTLLSFLSSTAYAQIQRLEINNQDFLRFQQLFQANDKKHEEFPYRETLLSLFSIRGKIIQFHWGKDVESVKSRNDFEQKFLSTMKWHGHDEAERIFDPDGNWTAFDILDALMMRDLSDSFRQKLVTEALKLLSHGIEIQQRQIDPNFDRYFLKSINRFLFLAESPGSNLNDDSFVLKLKQFKAIVGGKH